MAWQANERTRCQHCGTFDDEWRDPVTKRELDPPPYVVEDRRCVGCDLKAQVREDITKKAKRPESVYVYLAPYDPAVDEAEE